MKYFKNLSLQRFHRQAIIMGHVRYINILRLFRSFHDKLLYLVLFSLYPSLFWELKDKRSFKNLQFRPDSLGAMLEYWYFEHGLLWAIKFPFQKRYIPQLRLHAVSFKQCFEIGRNIYSLSLKKSRKLTFERRAKYKKKERAETKYNRRTKEVFTCACSQEIVEKTFRVRREKKLLEDIISGNRECFGH